MQGITPSIKHEETKEEQSIRNLGTFETAKKELRDIEQIEGLKPVEKIIENAIKNSPEVKKAKLEAEIIRTIITKQVNLSHQ
jgi:hypothetical protein